MRSARRPCSLGRISQSDIHASLANSQAEDRAIYSTKSSSSGFLGVHHDSRWGRPSRFYVTLSRAWRRQGPYPTVVNYSGYNLSQPGEPIPGRALCGRSLRLCDAPNDPSGAHRGHHGYATVSVNMRGTGFGSGGAYDYFEDLQLLDGYDVIETVAAQPWVLGNRVGMTEFPLPGITQLFVAKMHPPSLAAITPLSVIEVHVLDGPPGRHVQSKASPSSGSAEVLDKAGPMVRDGSKVRSTRATPSAKTTSSSTGKRPTSFDEAQNTPYYTDSWLGASVTFANDVRQRDRRARVPRRARSRTSRRDRSFSRSSTSSSRPPLTRITVYNGVHIDGFAPQVMVEWKTFLDLYVAHTVPSHRPASVRAIAPVLFQNDVQGEPRHPARSASPSTRLGGGRQGRLREGRRQVRSSSRTEATPANVGAPAQSDPVREALPRRGRLATAPLRMYFQGGRVARRGRCRTTGRRRSPSSRSGGGQPRDPRARTATCGDPLLARLRAWPELPAGFDVVRRRRPSTRTIVDRLGSASADLWIRSQGRQRRRPRGEPHGGQGPTARADVHPKWLVPREPPQAVIDRHRSVARAHVPARAGRGPARAGANGRRLGSDSPPSATSSARARGGIRMHRRHARRQRAPRGSFELKMPSGQGHSTTSGLRATHASSVLLPVLGRGEAPHAAPRRVLLRGSLAASSPNTRTRTPPLRRRTSAQRRGRRW